MILDLESVFQAPGFSIPFRYEINLAGETLYGNRPFREPVALRGMVQNTNGIVELSGTMAGVLILPCDRCAKEIRQPFSLPMWHTLVMEINESESEDLLLLDSPQLDLDALAREDLLLSLPRKSLCGEDCKGLCTQCGKDLNEGPCGCKQTVDPRLAVLQQLLKE